VLGETIIIISNVGFDFLVVALDLKFDMWRRLDGLVDIFKGLIECDEVSYVETGRMKGRPDPIQ